MNLNFSNIKVLVIGDFMIDHYIIGESNRMSPEAPVPVVVPKKEYSIPGGAGNVAMNLSKMGSKVTCMGAVGHDTFGESLVKELNRNNVNTEFIEVIADHQKTVFRKDVNNKDKFISTGLWSYSRHPNYLGEILLWFGVAIMSFSSLQDLQYFTLISPIFVYVLLVYISGIRILENQGDKKWGHLDSYKEYLKNTPRLLFRIFG